MCKKIFNKDSCETIKEVNMNNNNNEGALDKRAPEKYKNYEPEVILICSYCLGAANCWCARHAYKEQWKYVWDAVKNCKGF